MKKTPIMTTAIIVIALFIGYGLGKMDDKNEYKQLSEKCSFNEKEYRQIIAGLRDNLEKGLVGFRPPTQEYRVIGNVSGDFVISYKSFRETGPGFSADNRSKETHLNITIVAIRDRDLDRIYAFINQEE